MTLATKPKRPAHAKKRTGQHHRKNHHYIKTYWPYLPMLIVVGLGLLLNSAWPSKHSVLGYATEMSAQSLLNDTNAQRTSNGYSSLTLNSELMQAAQTKANDMAARDYWSHDTPDGRTPWSFITASGYKYSAAGENLAYGFTTSAYTVTAWMNSPEHRANILDSAYSNVGFGIANSPNYQGTGPETIVVAMYAEPAVQTVAATAPSRPTAPASAPAPTPQANAAPAPTASTVPVVPANSTPATTPANVQLTQEPSSTSVARVQLLAGNASWSAFAVSLISSIAIVVFLLRHALYWRRVLIKGEAFLIKHPLLDTAIVTLVMAGFILTRAAGVIR